MEALATAIRRALLQRLFILSYAQSSPIPRAPPPAAIAVHISASTVSNSVTIFFVARKNEQEQMLRPFLEHFKCQADGVCSTVRYYELQLNLGCVMHCILYHWLCQASCPNSRRLRAVRQRCCGPKHEDMTYKWRHPWSRTKVDLPLMMICRPAICMLASCTSHCAASWSIDSSIVLSLLTTVNSSLGFKSCTVSSRHQRHIRLPGYLLLILFSPLQCLYDLWLRGNVAIEAQTSIFSHALEAASATIANPPDDKGNFL